MGIFYIWYIDGWNFKEKLVLPPKVEFGQGVKKGKEQVMLSINFS